MAERAALAFFVAAAVVSLARGQASPWALALLVPLAASLVLQVRRVPGPLSRVLPRAAHGLVFLVFLWVMGWSLYFLLPAGLPLWLPRAAGHILAVLAVVFLLAPSVWPPPRAAIPAGLGVLFAAAAGPSTAFRPPAAAAALALAAWAVVQSPGAARRRWAGLGASAAASAGIALGIVRLLPWAQPQVEALTARMITPSFTTYAGLSPTARLGQIEDLALSRKVVLRLWSDRPSRLRARVLTRFDGTAWTEGRPAWQPLRPTGALPARLDGWAARVPGQTWAAGGGESLDPAFLAPMRITQESWNGGALVAPAGLRLLRLRGSPPMITSAGVLQPSPDGAAAYGAVRLLSAVDEGPCAECLETPVGLDPRLGALAERLAAEGASPAERVDGVTSYLEDCCRYTLRPGPFRSRQPVAEFLFEKKRGYCEYFASAAALLLRLQGLPARFVTGFNVIELNRRSGYYVVREADAHAWVEVRLPGRGWVEVDPTPAAQYEEMHAGMADGRGQAVLEWLRGRLAALRLRLAAMGWRGPAAVALLAGVLALAGRAALLSWRRRSPRPRGGVRATAAGGPVSPDLQAVYLRWERTLAARGFPRPPSRGPLEHLQGVPEDRLESPLRSAGARVVGAYYRARYSGASVGEEEVRELGENLRRATSS